MIRGFVAWLRAVGLGLWLWWHADHPSLLTDLEPYYRPVHRMPPAPPPGEPRPARAHCVNCGHRGSVLVPADGDQSDADLETQILDMLECPVCGLYTMCSD